MLLIQHPQGILIKVIRLLDNFHHCIIFFQVIRIVLFFALFADQQKSFFRNLKIFLMNRKIKELGFSTFQESGY